MSLTITINEAVPATLTVSVGTPGATGPAGATGAGVAVGGTTGQVLQKLSATNYDTGWATPSADFITAVTAPLSVTSGNLSVNLSTYLPLAGGTMNANATVDLSDTVTGTVSEVGGYGFAVSSAVNANLKTNVLFDRVLVGNATSTTTIKPTGVEFPDLTLQTSAGISAATAAATYQTLAGMSSYLTTATAASTYYLQTNPSGFQTAANVTTALSPYLLSATAASTYAVIAAGLPTGGTVGQVLTKNSGTNFDASFATLIPGDRYLTTSTTSLTINNANKTLTVGTGLSYTPTQNITISYDASNHMHGEVLTYNSGTGVLTVDVNNHTGTGTYAAWTVNVGGVTPATSVAWGAITGTLGDQTDLATALNNKLEVSTAASTYYLQTNPAGYQTAGDLSSALSPYLLSSTAASTYYPLAGNPSGFLTSAPVTSVAGMTGAVVLANTDISGLGTMATATAANYSTTAVANGLYYPLAGNPSSFLVAADITGKANLASPSFTGNVSITSSSGAALFIEQTGTGNILTLHDQASDTTFVTIDANGKVSTIASEATNGAGFNIAHGVAPTSPVNGDIWTTTAGLFARINGSTKTYANVNDNNVFTNASSTYGFSTGTGTTSLASGSTISGSTKTVNVATGGVSGSTTLTTIGPVLGASTTSIGNTTAASTLNLATGATLTATTKEVNIGTAGVAGSTTNIAIGSTTGTSTTTLQGTTNGITAAVDTNSVALATTAYVVGQAGSATPIVNGTAAVGTSLRYARQDHVHGTDTTRAPLASPTFTGTPTLPTGTIATTQTTGNNTTAVATTAFVTAAVPGFASTAEIASPSSTTKVVAPNDVVRMIVNRATFDTQNSSPTFATSGTGAEGYKATNDRLTIFRTPNAGIAGYGQMIYETTGGAVGIHGAKRGESIITQDWGKKIWMSGTVMFSSLGDANTVSYCMLGGRNTVTTGDPSNTNLRGIGWKLVGGGTALKLLTFGWNGSAVAVQETASSFTPVVDQSFDWMIMHAPNVANPATSYCYLYVDDALVATGIYSPADGSINYNYFYQSAESTSSVATPMRFLALPVKVWWSRS